MSNVLPNMFPVERTSDGRWAVRLDDSVVVVQTRGEAELLASLPIEYAAIHSDATRPPDRMRVRMILSVCENYRYTSHADRHLRRWLEQEEAHNQ